MDINKIHTVYCIGIGGIGVSNLARYFKATGKQVSGYDLRPSALTQQLIDEGIDIHFTDNPTLIPFTSDNKNHVLVIYTPAIPADHRELNYLKTSGFTLMKRSQVLGMIANQKETIAVAGTHGKTSVSGILSFILFSSDLGCSAFLGGIAKNFNSNLVLQQHSKYMLAEADEFDRSFLHLFPKHAIITSVDADHLDIYGKFQALIDSFADFAAQIQKGGTLLIKKNLHFDPKLQPDVKLFTYSIEEKADFYADNIRIENGKFLFDLNIGDTKKVRDISLNIPGRVNMENAVAAASMAYLLGVNSQLIRNAISNFKGIQRRFDYQIKTDDLIFIDDYAHHPKEIEATLLSLRELYPKKKITGVFQPHLFSRTRDFANEFAQSLSLLDTIILLDIYPAREKPIEGISSALIFDKIKNKEKILCKKKDLPEIIAKHKPEFLITLGAGDIDRLVPVLKQILSEL
ncbi:MAG: UDP-N-acetylmuramate--L-alanine ligase [Bacteroidota bacterium]|nr:UDP-N-acetylmuramate--L-alanine ligase [Bacteroidota bacterium]